MIIQHTIAHHWRNLPLLHCMTFIKVLMLFGCPSLLLSITETFCFSDNLAPGLVFISAQSTIISVFQETPQRGRVHPFGRHTERASDIGKNYRSSRRDGN